MKKFLSITLIIILLSGTVFIPGLSPRVNAAFDFKCGDNATWSYDVNTYTLTISGTGSTYDFLDGYSETTWSQSCPWDYYSNYIQTVVVEEGITRIGSTALNRHHCAKAKTLILPSTLKHLGEVCSYFETITIPSDNCLTYFDLSLKNTSWYAHKAGTVYLGKALVGCKSAGQTFKIKDGTLGIGPEAFKDLSNLSEITFPDSIEYVGLDAFAGTPWLENQGYGAVYIGRCFHKYIGEFAMDELDFVIREGTVSVSPCAANSKVPIKTVTVPQSVEYIGYGAFGNTKINDILFEENSKAYYIDDGAFGSSAIVKTQSDISLPSIQFIGTRAFACHGRVGGTISLGKDLAYFGDSRAMDLKVIISEDNPNFCSDADGTVYDKSREVLIRMRGKTDCYVPDNVKIIATYALYETENIYLPDNLQRICKSAFSGSKAKTLDFGYSAPEIDKDAFDGLWTTSSLLDSITVRSMTLTFPDGSLEESKWNDKFCVKCYPGSAMQEWCRANSVRFTLLTDNPILNTLNSALNSANSINRSLYTAESLQALDNAVSQVDLTYPGLTQTQADSWAQAINSALSALEYLPADYTAISQALSAANAINRLLYTADSLLALDTLVLSVDYGANITQQASIDRLAGEINAAISGLVYKEADYSAVNTAIARAVAIDRTHYTEQSLANLDNAIMIVEYGLDITFQSKVNAFASGIDLAVNALVAKPADYSNVETAIQRANAINRTLYTSESLAALDSAVAAVDYSLTASDSQTVADFAAAINSAIDNLEYLPADYTAVDNAIIQAESIDRIMWSDASLTALDQSIDSVDRSLNITQQTVVDAYAATIISKINFLEYASVLLRNDAHGVIVSATAKEIYPATSLTVEKLDPSDITGANFAVGGKVTNALYYDISLVRNGNTVQPGGTVTVKIRIPDGVEPSKCKVYHVTDDLVHPLVKFTSAIDGNYIVFETGHFSEFAVLEIETVAEGIVISKPPVKITYNKGEAFDSAGMVITAFYSDGTHSVVTDYEISVDTSTVGTTPLVVYYTFNGVTKSVSTVITVNDPAPTDSPVSNIKLKTPGNKTVEYRTKVTVVVRAGNLPDGCKVVLSANGKKVAEAKGEIRYYAGEITVAQFFSAKIIDSTGKTVCGTDGKELVSGFTVSTNGGFFAKIVAFFKALFRLLPDETVAPE